MKYFIILKLTAAILLYSSCVQKTFKKTVVFSLDTNGKTSITSVGIKGNNKPLSWKNITKLNALKNDSSIYTTAITFETGYTFTEVKFVINDTMELQDADNRRVNFEKGDTTFYTAVFNIADKK
ncbi:hypothetical protein ACFOWM_08735 [Ferruginibacter yonginensis]|uniref:Oxidoreductase n=1 Tax=Ferruginibacter yonginensis TaxID=1310416 RepID=A0ABV8QTI7_9BACT